MSAQNPIQALADLSEEYGTASDGGTPDRENFLSAVEVVADSLRDGGVPWPVAAELYGLCCEAADTMEQNYNMASPWAARLQAVAAKMGIVTLTPAPTK